MAREAFLINPVRRKRKKTKSSLFGSLFKNPKRRTKRNALPGPLLSRMIREYGPRTGMKKAWEEYRRGTRRNPFGEEVMIVGANPKRKRKRRNAWFDNTAGHRTAALKGWRKRRGGRRKLAANPRRRRAVARYRDNPRRARVRRYSSNRIRRYRRNPAAVATMGGISLNRPMSLLMPIGIGLAARIATQRAPIFLGMVAPLPRYGVQVAVAVGGGILLNRFVGKTNAMVWTIVSGVTILESILNEFVFRAVAVSGIGAFPESLSGVGYEEPETMDAYPYGGQVQY